MELLGLNPTSFVTQKPELDDLLICGACSTINVVTITGTRTITTEEFDALSADEKKDLSFALRASKRDLRN